MLSRETWVEVSLSTIQSNFYQAKNAINQSAVLPVLKANAYGHGLDQVGRLFDDMDLPFLCVASLDEAHQLIQAGVKKDILIFSYLDPNYVINNPYPQLLFTIPSLDWYQKVRGQGRFHLEINSGMNRMGVKYLGDVEKILASSEGDVEGIYTHFSSLLYDEQSKAQAQRFRDLYESLDYTFKYVHAGNVSVKLFNELKIFDSMRLGLALFGYREDIKLAPSLEIYSKVIYLVEVKADEAVGYSYNFPVKKDSIIATLPIGYADGFDKRQEDLKVWIKDSYYPIVGGICMDQTMVLVDKETTIGDRVEILGKHRSMEKICQTYKTSPYEVLVGIGKRLKRIYID